MLCLGQLVGVGAIKFITKRITQNKCCWHPFKDNPIPFGVINKGVRPIGGDPVNFALGRHFTKPVNEFFCRWVQHCKSALDNSRSSKK